MTKKYFIFSLLIVVNIGNVNNLSATALAKNDTKLPFSSGETLHYLLSYRGLLSSMIWADIADVKMQFIANKLTPEQQNGHQFVLNLTTKNYTKAEIIHPVRYTYTATMDEALHRTLLVEKFDKGASQSHEFLWLDWQNKETFLFKKRKKQLISNGFFGTDEKQVWEKDGKRGIPDFLSDFPLLDSKQTYLVHKKNGSKIENSQILEPLSMIYRLRSLDLHTKKNIQLIISEKIRNYTIERVGLEQIGSIGKKYQAIKYKVLRVGKQDKIFYIWLSNDKLKIPLRFAVDAPLGKLQIQLVKITAAETLAL
ncbi:MAG: DUF3108 domain-containing protein [Pseudomonadota bacterium]